MTSVSPESVPVVPPLCEVLEDAEPVEDVGVEPLEDSPEPDPVAEVVPRDVPSVVEDVLSVSVPPPVPAAVSSPHPRYSAVAQEKRRTVLFMTLTLGVDQEGSR
jgi:hypothetical protein